MGEFDIGGWEGFVGRRDWDGRETHGGVNYPGAAQVQPSMVVLYDRGRLRVGCRFQHLQCLIIPDDSRLE